MIEAWRVEAIEHLAKAYPNEGCGLVVRKPKTKKQLTFVPCKNLAAKPGHDFRLDPRDYEKAAKTGTIVAVVHSHPDSSARPSDSDRVMCEASKLPWHIVRIDQVDGVPEMVEWRSFDPDGYQAPLVGREFSYGVLDCYTIIRDYYTQELGIELADDDHGPDGWWDDMESDFNPYVDRFEKWGFYEVQQPSEKGDVILMLVRSKSLKPNHAGVYVGDGLMLHHLYGYLSCHEVYGGYWAKITRMVLRRKA